MSKDLLYHYFASKRDLYLETLHSMFATMSQIPEEFHELHTCLNAFFTYFEQSPALGRLIFHGGIGADAEALLAIASTNSRYFSSM